MIKDDFFFIDNKIAIENIGEHDADNRFMGERITIQMKVWKSTHPDCIPIGVCYDPSIEKYDGFFPMVFENRNGERFYTHIDIATIKEYIEFEKENDIR